MLKITLENEAGKKLTFGMGSPFTISEVDGIDPPAAKINTSQMALIDGAKFNSAKVDVRTINIAFAIEYSAPENRVAVYDVLKISKPIKLHYSGDVRDVYISGYVKSINISYFAKKQICTCQILCPSPFFMDAEMGENVLSSVVAGFHFPFASTATPELLFGYNTKNTGVSIVNDGDVDCGLIIEMYARSEVVNPKIFNYLTSEYFGLDFTMQTADLITIDTRQGQKTVKLLRNGEVTNIFNRITQGSTWLQLPAIGGTFVYETENTNGFLSIVFRHNNLYEGV